MVGVRVCLVILPSLDLSLHLLQYVSTETTVKKDEVVTCIFGFRYGI